MHSERRRQTEPRPRPRLLLPLLAGNYGVGDDRHVWQYPLSTLGSHNAEPLTLFTIGIVPVGRGEQDPFEAIICHKQPMVWRAPGGDPFFTSVRSEPRFTQLLSRIESDVAAMRARADYSAIP